MTILIIDEPMPKKRNYMNDEQKSSDGGKRMRLNDTNESDLGMKMKIEDLSTMTDTPSKVEGFEFDSNPKPTTDPNLPLSATITATNAVNQNLVYLLGNNNNNNNNNNNTTGLKQIIATTSNWRLSHINDNGLLLEKKRSRSQSPPIIGNQQPIERQLQPITIINNLPTTSITNLSSKSDGFKFDLNPRTTTNNNSLSHSCDMLPTTITTTSDSVIMEEDIVPSKSIRRSRRDMDCSTSSRKISSQFNKELKDLIKSLTRLTLRETSERHHKQWRNKQAMQGGKTGDFTVRLASPKLYIQNTTIFGTETSSNQNQQILAKCTSNGVMASSIMQIDNLATTTYTTTNTPPRTDGFEFQSPPPSERDCESEIDWSPPAKRSRFSPKLCSQNRTNSGINTRSRKHQQILRKSFNGVNPKVIRCTSTGARASPMEIDNLPTTTTTTNTPPKTDGFKFHLNPNTMINSRITLPITIRITTDSIIIEEDTISSRFRRRSRRDIDCSTASRKISSQFNKELKDLIKTLSCLTIRDGSENLKRLWRNKQPMQGGKTGDFTVRLASPKLSIQNTTNLASQMEIDKLPTTTTTTTNTPPRTDGFKFQSPPPSERDCQSEIDWSPPPPKRSRPLTEFFYSKI